MKNEIVAALREASCFGMPWSFREHLQELAKKLEQEPDWHALFLASLMKYGANREPGRGPHGHAMFGHGTLDWAKKHIELKWVPDPGALVLDWRAPSLVPPLVCEGCGAAMREGTCSAACGYKAA